MSVDAGFPFLLALPAATILGRGQVNNALTKTKPISRRAARNIEPGKNCFLVRIQRRPHNLYGGSFRTLTEALLARDRLEAQHPPKRPWGNTPRKLVRRTQADRHRERREAGLCPKCGTVKAPPHTSCHECRMFRRMKY
jgi:hypothetical protein